MKTTTNPPLDTFLKRLITAPRAKQFAAVESALSLLDGRPEDALAYKAAQAARLLNCSEMSLWRLRKKGLITPIKILGMTRYRRQDLLRLAGVEGAL